MFLNLHHQYEVFQCRILTYSMRRLLQHWTESSIILSSKERSVWRNKKPKKRTVSFAEDRSLTLIYEYFRVIGANDSVENYADLFTVALRNYDMQEFDSKWGRNSIINDANPIWWHLGKLVLIKNTRVWETQDRIEIVRPGDSSEEVRTWLSQIEANGEKTYRAESTN